MIILTNSFISLTFLLYYHHRNWSFKFFSFLPSFFYLNTIHLIILYSSFRFLIFLVSKNAFNIKNFLIFSHLPSHNFSSSFVITYTNSSNTAGNIIFNTFPALIVIIPFFFSNSYLFFSLPFKSFENIFYFFLSFAFSFHLGIWKSSENLSVTLFFLIFFLFFSFSMFRFFTSIYLS